MFSLFQHILNSKRIKKVFDIIFDIAIMLSVGRLAITLIFSLAEPVIPLSDRSGYDIFNLKKIISLALNTLIAVKIYRILYHFIGDHTIKLTELIEIAITGMIIKMVFDNVGYDRPIIGALALLILTFLTLRYAHHKKIITDEETHERSKQDAL